MLELRFNICLLLLLSLIVPFFSIVSPPRSKVLIVRTSLASDCNVSSLTCSSLTPVLKKDPRLCCLSYALQGWS